jgi:hypothetical protein
LNMGFNFMNEKVVEGETSGKARCARPAGQGIVCARGGQNVSLSELWSWCAPQYWHCIDDSYGVKEKDGRGECKGYARARACASGVKGTGPVLDAEWLFVRLNSLWRKKILAGPEAFVGETMTVAKARRDF